MLYFTLNPDLSHNTYIIVSKNDTSSIVLPVWAILVE